MPTRNGGRVPPRKSGNQRARATLPTDVIQATGRAAQGVGSRFMEAATREPDLGHGLPVAAKPVIAATPAEIRSRANQKREANRRKGNANNVRGYGSPGVSGDPRQLRGPGAIPSLNLPLGEIPTAEELLRLTNEQEYASTAVDEGTYRFPQVQPTKTINPIRPRTLESGWESIRDRNDERFPGILRVRFRDGTPWEYYQVPSEVWQRFKRVQSPGRFINRVLNNYPYARGDF